MFKEAMHGLYLKKTFLESEIGFSFPRIRPCVGGFSDIIDVTDKNLVQCIVAMRNMVPNSVLNTSTREAEGFRDHLIQLSFKNFMEVNNKLYTENGINSKKVVDNFYFIGNKFKEYKMIGISIHSYKEGMQACKVLNS